MKNKNNNNESSTKTIINQSDNIKKENNKNTFELKQRINRAENLFEYFVIIGLDPKIASKNFLYELSSSDISQFHSDELKPKIISKYPPIEKTYINIDENICELCFPEGIKLEKYKNQPQPEIYHFLLGNYFYSIEHPLKYLTCLKFYESLDKYKILQKKIEKLNENKNNSFENDINNISKEINNNNINNIKRNKSQNIKKIKNYKKNFFFTGGDEHDLSQYYFPKIICFLSLKPNYKIQKTILLQLYNYCNIKKIKIPIEKIVLNILVNIPNPPRGIHFYQYNMSDDFKKINIKSEKMNKINNFDDELRIIFEYFNIDDFLEIFRYTLFETKTIIFCSKINHLCSLVHGLISILYPFAYPFQVSSCIREDAFQLLESISPYILGINQKYNDHFFSDNNIEIKNANFLIIDLDNKEYTIHSVEELPDIPKSILKKFNDRIEINSKKKEINEEKNEEENSITFAFYEFFLNILINYSDFLNNDNLKKNFKISNLKILFKTKEFIESHPFNERPFYKKLTETQMFNDFIFKKMIPKDIEDKLDILLFDENINKINNTKKKFFFFKNKSTSFLSTKEYDFKNIHKIPKAKELLKAELDKYKNKNYYKKNLIKGQDIIIEKNDYFFNYILFPKLNTDYYYFPSSEFFIYYYTIENIKNDINRVNTDLIAKSSIKSGNINSLSNEEEVILDYIYLTYIEVWGYSFWYQDLSERDYRFKQLLEVLDKIKRQEIELYNVLFEILNKFHEKRKIRKLYNKILEYKLTPDSFIYSIVGKNLKKNDINEDVNSYIFLGKKEEKSNFQRRTFKSTNDINIIGDNIYFDFFQECPECSRIINIKNICKNYKKMRKELLWAQCPLCFSNIKPQISVTLGNDIFPGTKNFSLQKKEYFTLYSPYELKNSIKKVINLEKFSLLNIDELKIKYPCIFWNCILYFHLYHLDYSIILPYEVNIYKKHSSRDGINTPFIITKICPLIRDNEGVFYSKKNKENKENKENKDNTEINKKIILNNDNNSCKRFKNKNIIIHNIFSFQILSKKNKKEKIPLGEFLDFLKAKKEGKRYSSFTFTNKFKTPDKNNNNEEKDNDKTNNENNFNSAFK